MKSAVNGPLPASASDANRRVICATVVVVALHLMLIAFVLTKRDATSPVALESRTITAELLQPEPVTAPAAIQSMPVAPPKPTTRVTREKTEPHVAPKPAPTPLPAAQAPAPQPTEPQTPASPPVSPAQPSAPTTSAALAQAPPTMALNAPRNVSHLDCRIVEPDYPSMSKRRGETGVAYVRFVVGLTGQIENVELRKSSGYGRLDDAALQAMRESTCKPYLENGEPVRALYTQPFDFSLQD